MALTVAIPVYSEADWFIHSLQSCLRQTDSDFEILICVNRPGDRRAHAWVATQAPEVARRIRVVENDVTLPMADNWNRCLDEARTPYVTLLHEDDLLRPTYVAEIRAAIGRHPAASGWFTDVEIVDERGDLVRSSLTDWVRRWVRPSRTQEFVVRGPRGIARLALGNFVYPPSLCLHRDQAVRLRYASRWGFVTDLDFLVRTLESGGYWIGLPIRAVAYRRHAGATTQAMTRDLKRFEEELTHLGEIARRAEARGEMHVAKVARMAPLIRAHIALRALGALLRLRGDSLCKLVRLMIRRI